LKSFRVPRTSLNTLPEWIGELKSLKKLHCEQCALMSLPSGLLDLSLLEEFSCAQNESLNTLPEWIGQLKSLKKFDCRSCGLSSLPPGLCDLELLEEFSCSKNGRLKNFPERIGNLKSLKKFDCEECALSSLPPGLCDLRLLKEFSCAKNGSLTMLPDRIGNMNLLETLDCSECDLSSLPSALCDLTLLREFSCSKNESLDALPERIGNIQSLEELDCHGCGLLSLPQGLCDLPFFAKFSCSFNKSLKTLPAWIGGLRSLQTLDLRGEQSLPANLTDLPNLAQVQCGPNPGRESSQPVTTIPRALLFRLPADGVVVFKKNSFTDPLTEMRAPFVVHIIGGHILDMWISGAAGDHSSQKRVHRVIRPSYRQDPWGRVIFPPGRLSYLEGFNFVRIQDLQRGTLLRDGGIATPDQVRLLVVGHAGVGKTTLVEALTGSRGTFGTAVRTARQALGRRAMTVGVDQRTGWDPGCVFGETGTCVFNIWDFAGQLEYHAMHQLFLTPESVVMLVFDVARALAPPSAGNAGRKTGATVAGQLEVSAKLGAQHGESGLEAALGYLWQWIHMIGSRAPGARVVLVGTHADCAAFRSGGSAAEELRSMLRRFVEDVRCNEVFVRIVGGSPMSERDASSRNTSPDPPPLPVIFVDALHETASSRWSRSRQSSTKSETPLSSLTRWLKIAGKDVLSTRDAAPLMYVSLANAMRNMATELRLPIVAFADFEQLVREHIDATEDPRTLARLLHEWGYVCWFDEAPQLRDRIFVDPRWLSMMMTAVMTHDGAVTSRGTLRRSDLVGAWASALPSGSKETSTLIDVMLFAELMFSAGERETSDSFVVPTLLPVSAPAEVARMLAQATLQAGTIRSRCDMSVRPSGLLPRWLARLHGHRDLVLRNAWRRGALVVRRGGSHVAVTAKQSASTSEDEARVDDFCAITLFGARSMVLVCTNAELGRTVETTLETLRDDFFPGVQLSSDGALLSLWLDNEASLGEEFDHRDDNSLSASWRNTDMGDGGISRNNDSDAAGVGLLPEVKLSDLVFQREWTRHGRRKRKVGSGRTGQVCVVECSPESSRPLTLVPDRIYAFRRRPRDANGDARFEFLLRASSQMRFSYSAHVCLPVACVVDPRRPDRCQARPGPEGRSTASEQDPLMLNDANDEWTDNTPARSAVGLLLRLYDGSLADEIAAARASDAGEIGVSGDDVCEWVYQLLVGLSDLHARGGVQGDVRLERVLVRRSQASRPGSLLFDHLAWSPATLDTAMTVTTVVDWESDVEGFRQMLSQDLIPLLKGSTLAVLPWQRLLRDLEKWCTADIAETDDATTNHARTLLQRFLDRWAALSAFHG
jgi:Leucine-rich repeat (LRR) protein/GTPase SAR1 family protein